MNIKQTNTQMPSTTSTSTTPVVIENQAPTEIEQPKDEFILCTCTIA